MDFKNLVKFIKAQGCKVRIYKKKKRLVESNAIGLFVDEPHPHILMATKGHSKKEQVSVLLHEYAHFCQWRDGFSKYLDGICWADLLWHDWLENHVELNKREIGMVRNILLSVEYDAEKRSYAMGLELGVEGFDARYHLQEAQSYMASIKWSFAKRKDWKKRPKWKLFPPEMMSHEKLFAKLTKKEKEIMKHHLKVKR